MVTLLDRIRTVKDNLDNSEELTEHVDDKQLISLRRQRQLQLNKMEKERLKKVITKHNKFEFGKNMGFSKPKEKILYGKHNRKTSLLNDKNPLLKSDTKMKQGNIMKSEINILKTRKGFIK